MKTVQPLRPTPSTSQIIQFLRFPLIVGVVFVHCVPAGWLGTPLTLVLGQSCVPTFFIISGYLFFSHLEQWQWGTFVEKLRKRIRSLLIPFLIWNLLLALFICRADILHAQFPHLWQFLTERGLTSVFTSYWRIPSPVTWLSELPLPGSLPSSLLTPPAWYQPLNVPLWYQRDLIVLCLLAPVIYFLVKPGFTILSRLTSSSTLVVLILLLLLSGGYFPLRSLTFFAMGAAFRLHHLSPVAWSRCHRRWLWPLSAVLFVAACFTQGATTPWGTLLLPLFILTAPFIWFAGAERLLRRDRVHEIPALTSACYLIYVLHFRPMLAYTDSVAHWLLSPILFSPSPMLVSLYATLCYLLSPVLAVALCVIIHAVGMRLIPRTLSFMTGGRA